MGFGLRVQGSGFRVSAFGFRVSMFGVSGAYHKHPTTNPEPCIRCGVPCAFLRLRGSAGAGRIGSLNPPRPKQWVLGLGFTIQDEDCPVICTGDQKKCALGAFVRLWRLGSPFRVPSFIRAFPQIRAPLIYPDIRNPQKGYPLPSKQPHMEPALCCSSRFRVRV